YRYSTRRRRGLAGSSCGSLGGDRASRPIKHRPIAIRRAYAGSKRGKRGREPVDRLRVRIPAGDEADLAGPPSVEVGPLGAKVGGLLVARTQKQFVGLDRMEEAVRHRPRQ